MSVCFSPMPPVTDEETASTDWLLVEIPCIDVPAIVVVGLVGLWRRRAPARPCCFRPPR